METESEWEEKKMDGEILSIAKHGNGTGIRDHDDYHGNTVDHSQHGHDHVVHEELANAEKL